jgi:hypothetical protein
VDSFEILSHTGNTRFFLLLVCSLPLASWLAVFRSGASTASTSEPLGVDLPLEVTEDMLFDLAFGDDDDVFFSPMHYPGGPANGERKLGGTARKPRSPPARLMKEMLLKDDTEGSDSGSVQSRKLKRKGTDEPDELYVSAPLTDAALCGSFLLVDT